MTVILEHNSITRSAIQAVCHGVEIVVEQPGVHVESHGGAGMSEHPLDTLDVGTFAHCE